MSNGMGFQEQHWNPNVNNAAAMRGNVMTEQQIETLKIQIAAFEALSEQLAKKCRAHLAARQARPEVKPTNMYGDTSKGVLLNRKRRWTPTTEQLKIMEGVFNHVTKNPDKKRINEITAELTKHGNISEKSVYNWFQNKRARSKKKDPNAVANNVNTKPQ